MLKVTSAFALIIAVFLVYVARKPSHQVIARSTVINAAPDKVFPYINNRTIANRWNPFLQQDTTAKITVSGPEVGVGAKTSWQDGKDLGTGSAEVIEVVPNDHLVVRLVYEKPFEMTQTASYWLEAIGHQTKVTWKVEGDATFLAKLMCTFMNPEEMVGEAFLKGLGQLKTMVEAAQTK